MAEEEVTREFAEKEKRIISIVRLGSLCVAAVFVVATVTSFVNQDSQDTKWALFTVMLITTVQAVLPFFNRKNWIIGIVKRNLKKRQLTELDRRKSKYISIVK